MESAPIPESPRESKGKVQPVPPGCGDLCRQRIRQQVRRFVTTPEEVEDCCQDVCLRCTLGHAKFRGQAGFATWLYRLVVNVCADHRRKKRSEREIYETEMGAETFRAAWEAQAGAHTESPSVTEQVRAALAQLPPHQSQLLEWKYFEGLTHGEIAQRRGIKVQSARAALRRARAAFQRVYNALDKDTP
jgi:RNA polymerase sigma-70 factor (ECF subfamily)